MYFFRFVGCDSVFLEYSRIDVFASLELLLTFWVHNAYFRLVNLFRLQSFILLNVCSRVFSYGHIYLFFISVELFFYLDSWHQLKCYNILPFSISRT